MKKLLIAAAAVALSSAPAYAAGNSANATGTASATVVAPIAITHTSGASLNFGAFASSAGTVTVYPDGTNNTVGVNLINSVSTAADSFDVTGDATRVFTITLPATASVSNGAATPVTMAFVPSAVPTATLDATGKANFKVGGQLTVAGTEPAGSYSGSYAVTVTYQ